MNRSSKRTGALENAPLTFLLVMGVLLLALGWLGWLLLDQDLSLQQELKRNRIDSAAEDLSNALILQTGQALASLESAAQSLASSAVSNRVNVLRSQHLPMLVVHFEKDEMAIEPASGLRYVPMQKAAAKTIEAFILADRLEFQQESLAEAIELLEPLEDSPDQLVQAQARLRLGRISYRAGDMERALDEYAQLADLNDQLVRNIPAPWLAHYARCKIYAATNDEEAFGAELRELSSLLATGGAPVSKSTWRFYAQAVNTWVTDSPKVSDSFLLPLSHGPSDAVEALHRIWTDRLQGRGSATGMQVAGEGQASLILIWTSGQSNLLGGVMNVAELHRGKLLQSTGNLEANGMGWSISDSDGRNLLADDASPVAPASSLTLAIGDSPLTVSVFETASMVLLPEDIRRRQLLLAGLAVVLIVILTSTFFIVRALRREAEIAELQADFVSAVSHEFRTPLTSIRQLLELLASGRIKEPEKISNYYRILDKESARLQRMVEDLLDFRRMESNARPYHLESIEVGSLLGEIIDAFREEYDLDEKTLVLDVTGNQYVRMDRESLARAIWNLLDNAVKYSKDEPRITVTAGPRGNRALIAIADCGIGISKEEQTSVFRKFVRGSAAKHTHVKGTGLGLAMVRKTLEDQGATIELQSSPGKGSTFTIILELENPA